MRSSTSTCVLEVLGKAVQGFKNRFEVLEFHYAFLSLRSLLKRSEGYITVHKDLYHVL